MADKDPEDRASDNIPPGSASALAAAIAQDRTKADPVQSSRAEIFLEEQTKLIRLQTEQLNEQRRLLLGSLRFRHFRDVLGAALQLIVGVLGVGVLIALAATVWSAAHDNALVVEAFDVPPDFMARGLSGRVVASRLLDNLAELQDQTASDRAPGSYKNNWGNDIKVQIPDTGISVGEFYRYLCQWLGHETRIGGEIYHTPSGIAVTARAGGMPGHTFEGTDASLPKLLQAAAEDVYRNTQPYRYSVYLDHHARQAESEQVLGTMLAAAPEAELKWAHLGLANARVGKGDYANATEEVHKAIARDGDFGPAFHLLASIEAVQGHDEKALQALDAGILRLGGNGDGDLTRSVAEIYAASMRARRDDYRGDFAAALHDNEIAAALPDYKHQASMAEVSRAADLARLHDLDAAMAQLRSASQQKPALTIFLAQAALVVAVESGDRASVDARLGAGLGPLRGFLRPADAAASVTNPILACMFQPLATEAALQSGAMVEARTRARDIPRDCYAGLLALGKLESFSRNWSGAAAWFDRAIAQAPSLPFAYSGSGAMLLAKGDADGAIAALSAAHQKGPHFADALELWGEALIARNRSDQALAKFSEAAKYAPNWGRLHLKWGGALLWSGDVPGARRQFATARRLVLSPSEKAELAELSSRSTR